MVLSPDFCLISDDTRYIHLSLQLKKEKERGGDFTVSKVGLRQTHSSITIHNLTLAAAVDNLNTAHTQTHTVEIGIRRVMSE